jgi:transposase
MPSVERLSRFIVHRELKILDWVQTGKAHSEARCEKVSKGEVCPRCASFSSSIYDRRWVKIKDAPIRNCSVALIIRKRRFYCKTCRKPFTEPVPGVMPRKRTTQRLQRAVTNACQKYSSLKDVRRDFRCSNSYIYRAFYSQLKIETKRKINYPWPKTIGIDEHFFTRKQGYREFMTIFVDYRNKRPRELVLGRTSHVLQAAIGHIEGRENVANVVMDLSRPYKTFVKDFFPKAQIIADKFHVLRLLNGAINRVRKQYTGDDRKNPIRRLLLCSAKRLDYFKRKAIWDWLKDKPDLKELYHYKEALHQLYRTRGHGRARRALVKLTDQMAYSNLREIRSLRNTLRTWSTEILAYFKTGLTNARTEGFNNVAKTIQKRGYGFKNPENYRLRVLNA